MAVTMSAGVAIPEQNCSTGSFSSTTIRADAGGNIIIRFTRAYTYAGGDADDFVDIQLTCDGTTYIRQGTIVITINI